MQAEADESMEVDGGAGVSDGGAGDAPPPPASDLPEVEAFVLLVATMFLLDKELLGQANEAVTHAVGLLQRTNRRTMDVIGARICFYYSWVHECQGDLATVRGTLLALQRRATLHHDHIGQETLLNLLLHNFLHYNLYGQAEQLRSKTQIPDGSLDAHQQCRYQFYLGRIRAIQLEYTEARDSLQQALRRAPELARGFRITLHKWLAVVQLLLGEIPARTHFTVPGMRGALRPYFDLAAAVRSGDLRSFENISKSHHQRFLEDRTHNLVERLRNNVIRTGLRRISLAYSRISLSDVAKRLGLPSTEDAESIVAKAIRDGGVEAVIDHGAGCLKCREVVDIYSTTEPQEAFHARIAFCMDLHNETLKAMRYEPESKESLESAEARKERLQQEQEFAKAIQDDDDEDF